MNWMSSRKVSNSSFSNFINTLKIETVEPSSSIICFVESPTQDNIILAATRTQVLALNADKECSVIAGEEPAKCELKPNPFVFYDIRHIVPADFQRANLTFAFPHSLLIADIGDHCIKIANLHNHTDYYSPIGTCGVEGGINSNINNDLSDVNLRRPLFLAIDYSSDYVRLVITGRQTSDEMYIVVIMFHSTKIISNEYFSEKVVTHINADFGVVLTTKRSNVKRNIMRMIEGELHSYEYLSNDAMSTLLPIQYLGHLFILTPSHRMISLGDTISFFETNVNLPISTDINLLASSTRNDGGIIIYSADTNTFYFFAIEPLQTTKTGRHHFYLAAKDNTCGGNVSEEITVVSVEQCAYYCLQHIWCYAISFHNTLKKCLTFQHQQLLFSHHQPGYNCYFL